MNSITETFSAVPLGDLRRPEETDDAAPSQRVGAGALDPLSAPNARGRETNAARDFHSPPPPRETATLRMAEGALNRILAVFGPRENGKPITLAQLERTPMEAMSLAASLLGVKALGDSADLKSLALEIRTQGAENLRLRQNEDLRKQVDKAIEDSQKAQKAGIFSAIVDWIVAIAEVVSGVLKIAVGCLTGAANSVAGGAMDLAAGCAGLVKAMCSTLALIDPKNAERYKEVGDVAGKVQLAFEIAGMVVDFISVGRGVMAAKTVANTTKTVVEKGAGELLENTIKQASGTAGKEVAQEVIKNVAQQVATEVAEKTASEVAKKLSETAARFFGQGQLLQAFSKQAIETMVSKAVETVATKALKSGAEATAQELTRQIVKQVQREIVQAAVSACLKSAPNVVKAVVTGGVQGANGIAQGAIAKERAELQKIVQQLIAEGNFMQFMLDEFDKLKKRAREDIGQLMDGAGKALASGSESQLKTGAVLSSIAANIA